MFKYVDVLYTPFGCVDSTYAGISGAGKRNNPCRGCRALTKPCAYLVTETMLVSFTLLTLGRRLLKCSGSCDMQRLGPENETAPRRGLCLPLLPGGRTISAITRSRSPRFGCLRGVYAAPCACQTKQPRVGGCRAPEPCAVLCAVSRVAIWRYAASGARRVLDGDMISNKLAADLAINAASFRGLNCRA